MANINKIRISGTSYDIQDSNAPKVVELTQAQYDALVDKDPNVFYIITDASQVDLSQYWTSAQTNSAITEAVSRKADSSSVYLKSETSGATEISTALNDKLDVTAYTPTDLSNYYTTAQTNTKISQAVSGKTNQSDFTAHTANTTVHVTASEKSTWNSKSDFSGSYNDLTNKLSAGTNVTIVDNVINAEGGGSTYTAGRGIDITNDVISVTGMVDTTTYSTYTAATDTALSNKQTTLTAGTGISIVDNVISATGGGGGGNVNVVELTQAQYDALTTIDPDAIYVITDAQGGDLSQYMTSAQTTSAITQATSDKVSTSAITTSITSSSTDAQIPTAKAVYDIVGDIETLLSQI